MITDMDIYLVKNERENRSYLHVPGCAVLNYHRGVLESISEDKEALDLMDYFVLILKEQNSDKIKLITVKKETLRYLLDNGRKFKKLYESSQTKASQIDPKKREQFRKVQIRFQKAGRNLMDIIERDLDQERRAAEEFDKMTDQEKEKLVEEVLAGR